MRPKAFLWNALTAGLFLFVGAYFYLSHLSGAIPSTTDENRVYHLTMASPLKYFICSFFTRLFKSYDAPFYVMGAFSFLSIPLIYYITRSFFSSGVALLAALFYLFYDFPLTFTKYLYYCAIVVFFMLASMTFYILACKTKRKIFLLVSGITMGLMFVTNSSSYLMVFALCSFYAYLSFKEYFGKHFSLWKTVLWVGAGFLLAYGALELFCYFRYADDPTFKYYTPFWKFIIGYQDRMSGYGPQMGLGGLWTYLHDFLWREAFLASPSYFFRNALIVSVVLLSAGVAVARRDGRMLGFFLLALSGLALLAVNVLFKVHVVQDRILVWVAVPTSVAFGYGLHALLGHRRRWVRGSVLVLALFYFFFAGMKCHLIVTSMVSKEPILRYLKERGIPKKKVLSMYPIYEYRDFIERDLFLPPPLLKTTLRSDNEKGIYYVLHWPAIFNLFRQGRIEYYLSSGLLHWGNIGTNDEYLAAVSPRMAWKEHPNNNPHLHHEPTNHAVKFYALRDIFTHPGNQKRLIEWSRNILREAEERKAEAAAKREA